MRANIYEAVSSAVYPVPVFESNSVDTVRERPFAILRWEEHNYTFGRALGPQKLAVWVHDSRNDYQRINEELDKIEDVLTAMVHVGSVSQVKLLGRSADLYDDGFKTITRYTWVDINPTAR